MIDKHSQKDSYIGYILDKLILLILFLALLSICIYIPYYIAYKIPEDRVLIYQIRSANKIFANKEYYDALTIYIDLVDKYPKFEYGIKQAALCAFSLIKPFYDSNEGAFNLGMYYLSKLKKIDEGTIKAIEKKLPDNYVKQFKELLQ